MEIRITGEEKEIVALIGAIQGRQQYLLNAVIDGEAFAKTVRKATHDISEESAESETPTLGSEV